MQITPLYKAIRRGHADAVRLLLEHGAYVDWKDEHGWTYLHYAALVSAVEAAKVLLHYMSRYAKDTMVWLSY